MTAIIGHTGIINSSAISQNSPGTESAMRPNPKRNAHINAEVRRNVAVTVRPRPMPQFYLPARERAPPSYPSTLARAGADQFKCCCRRQQAAAFRPSACASGPTVPADPFAIPAFDLHCSELRKLAIHKKLCQSPHRNCRKAGNGKVATAAMYPTLVLSNAPTDF